MFGQNPVRNQEHGDGQTLWIQEVFHTIQGEGPYVGMPAVFVRLAGCNLKCHFCDTDFESSDWKPSLEELISKITEINTSKTSLIVLTGGEPMRQNIMPLMYALNSGNHHVQIETAGTLWIPEFEKLLNNPLNSIVCSPKTPVLNRYTERFIFAYKYVIRKGETSPTDGLPCMSTQRMGVIQTIARPVAGVHPSSIFLQPCDEGKGEGVKNGENLEHARDLCLKFGYRMSVQLHKLLDLP